MRILRKRREGASNVVLDQGPRRSAVVSVAHLVRSMTQLPLAMESREGLLSHMDKKSDAGADRRDIHAPDTLQYGGSV